MKTIDFEKAIKTLCVDIIIDEVKLRHSNVRQVNAHTEDKLLVWDEYGRAFSANKDNKREIFFSENEDGNFEGQLGIPLERDSSFDLTFE